MSDAGTLYLVATPIGNMDDLSPRAQSCLEAADIVACEDTRRTGLLLSRLGFKRPFVSYHNVNEARQADRIVAMLEEGKTVALVSDAGTPGVSDPAYRLVSAAVRHGITVISIPGPSAVLSALVVSGFPLDRFVFEGFLPQKGSKRRARLASLRDESRTIVLFESPFRILGLVGLIRDELDDREISVSRELTKLHEETVRGRASEVYDLLAGKKPRGEYTVVVRGAEPSKGEPCGEC